MHAQAGRQDGKGCRGANTKATKRGVRALAMPPWPPLDMSAGDVSIYHRGTAPFLNTPPYPAQPATPLCPMSIGEFASSAYRHPANTRRNALACVSMSVDVRAYTRIDVFDSQATLARC